MDALGQKLREAREGKGLSIEEVARMTKIPDKIIEAIEQSYYEELPAPIYVKGFLKLYARYVGLEPNEVIQDYQRLQGRETKQVLILEGEKVKGPSFFKVAMGSLFQLYRLTLTFLKKISKTVWLGVGGGVLLISLLMILIGWLHSKPLKTEPSPSDVLLEKYSSTSLITSPVIQTDSLNTGQEASLVGKDKLSVVNPVSDVTSSSDLVLVAEAKERVWIRVRGDDQRIFEGILKKGSRETWHAHQFFSLKIGKPEAIHLTLNGKDLEPLKGSRKIKEVRVNKNGWVK
ncbi:MAG: helix-turn-helix domain-containing protein [Chlamydiae bacterium]|nr:helix-turn-helix domain-containing protein [Chlamydiota bacterium]MBI3277913.1 helix-turn-helix domain-containing protein [Chlamydiota bacterium]